MQETLELRCQYHVHTDDRQQESQLETVHHLGEHLPHASDAGGVAWRQTNFLYRAVNISQRIAQRFAFGEVADHSDLTLAILAVDLYRSSAVDQIDHVIESDLPYRF